MTGIAELATSMMAGAQRRLAITANNLSNMSTPGYQARRVFSRVVEARGLMPVDDVVIARGAEAAAMKATGDAWDVAADGAGMLMLRVGESYRAVASAQLHRDGEGRLVDAGGGVLQAAEGGDLVIQSGSPTILGDGTILIAGQAVGRVGVFAASGGAEDLVALPEDVDDPVVRQGYLAASRVDTATEMLELTRAGRLAETGARVFQLYDDLSGRVTSRLGEIAR